MNEPGPSSAYYRRFAQQADGPIRPPSPPGSPLLPPTQTTAQFLDSEAEDSLYAVLNVEHDASLAELKDKYRALAAIYHPDKQPDDVRRRAAHDRFMEISRAYEILTDPGKRAIYDLFGEEGLRTSWEVGPRGMTPAEMKAHYQRQGDTKRRIDVEALVNSKSDMSVTLDARGVFLPKSVFSDPSVISHSPMARIRRVNPSQIILKHSFELPVNEQTQFVIEETMVAVRGQGGAGLSGTIKHQFSPRLWVQYTQAVLAPFTTSFKGTYTYDENTYVTMNAVQQVWAAPPGLHISLGRRIYPEATGYITYNTGFWTLGPWGRSLQEEMYMVNPSSMAVGITSASHNGDGWTTELRTGFADNGLSGDWTTHAWGLRLKTGLSWSLMGSPAAFADVSGRVTENTRAGALLEVNLGGGIQLRLTVNRLGQKLAFPILLSADLNPYVAFCTTVLPASAYAALYHFYILPRKHERIKNRIHELRVEHADYIAAKRQEAGDAVLLMERSVQTRTEAERQRDGLVILSASYGLATAFTPRGLREIETEDGYTAVIDVTIPVQALVQNSRLVIPAGRAKHNLLGFYDPCIGENKKLRIRYLFRGRLHEITVDDVSGLRAPVKSHALED